MKGPPNVHCVDPKKWGKNKEATKKAQQGKQKALITPHQTNKTVCLGRGLKSQNFRETLQGEKKKKGPKGEPKKKKSAHKPNGAKKNMVRKKKLQTGKKNRKALVQKSCCRGKNR